MAIEVLLMETVRDLGEEGQVARVAEGYARNYLFPRKLAAPVTAESRARLARLLQGRAAERALARQGAQELANRLAGVSCTIAAKTADHEKLFGSVTAADIAASLHEQGIEVDRHAIRLDAPLKELGVFDVTIRLHPEVDATVKVWVVEE